MKALAIDSSTPRISFAAFNGNLKASFIMDAQLRQSEKLVPSIEYVLKQAELEIKDLEFLVIATGPGSFTGLRLGFSALKAIQMATNCPLYGVPTLKAYQNAFADFNGTVVPVLDAKKERFYVSIYRNGVQTNVDDDLSASDALKLIDNEENILLCGEDASLFKEKMLEIRPTQAYTLFNGYVCTASQLLYIGEQMHKSGAKPLNDYDGPVYIRKSEAEENVNKRV